MALPFLRRAEAAVDSIKPADINELKGMRQAVDTTRLIMDTIHILFQRPLDPVKPKAMNILKQECPFVGDSFDNCTKTTLASALFLKDLFDFSNNEKDNINEETIELLEPYLLFTAPDGREIFTGAVAKKSSSALEGMCVWAAAMSDYHKQSKIVKPKLEALRLAEARLQDAQRELDKAEQKLQVCQDVLDKLKDDFEA